MICARALEEALRTAGPEGRQAVINECHVLCNAFVMPEQTATELLNRGLYWTDWARLRLVIMAAALPRLVASSPLGILPPDLIQHIAMLAHRPRVQATFSIDTDKADEGGANLRVSHGQLVAWRRIIRDDRYHLYRIVEFYDPSGLYLSVGGRGIQYVEIEFTDVWYNSGFKIGGTTMTFEQPGDPNEIEHDDVAEYIVTLAEDGLTWYEGQHVSAWDEWNYNGKNAVGLLLDMDAGRVRWILNGIPGPVTNLSPGFEDGIKMLPRLEASPAFADSALDDPANPDADHDGEWRKFGVVKPCPSFPSEWLDLADDHGHCRGATGGCPTCRALREDRVAV